jgi:hypothetical protein
MQTFQIPEICTVVEKPVLTLFENVRTRQESLLLQVKRLLSL